MASTTGRPGQLALPLDTRERGCVLLAAGPRVAEERVLDEVLTAARARTERLRGGELTSVRAPLRVVVPSRSLRQHLAARLVERAGSLLGVAVQTHVAVALETLARAGAGAPRGDSLVPVLVRRHAAREPVLCDWLGTFEEGFAAVEGAVRDLLDAGFDAGLAEPLDDALAELVAAGELGAATAGRARAVAAVAGQTLAALDELGLGHRSALLARATDVLRAPGTGPAAVLPTAGLWIHGFADATGLVGDWLEALARAFAGRVVVDLPPDPAEPARREEAYTTSLRERMAGAAGRVEALAARAAPAALELLQAPGAEAEARAVALRVRERLDAGVQPEAIGIVARRLEPHRAALAAQLGRLGVPFSVIGAGAGPDASTRRAAALVALLREQAAAPVDTWFAADAHREAEDADLRMAFHVLGVGRLTALAGLDPAARLAPRESLSLPLRRGGSVGTSGGERGAEAGEAAPCAEDMEAAPAAAPADPTRNRRRNVSLDRLVRARERALVAVATLASWPAQAELPAHLERLDALVAGALGWRADRAGCEPLLGALDELGRELPPGLLLAREELAQLVASALEEAGEASLGGAGAGVQVLTVTAARGRTFEHLFLLGLNRDAFPRGIGDDPLLPDALRARLRVILPEMPVKARARDEDRHLFASLCDAAPQVTLAWQHADDDGRRRIESPFVVRLRVARRELAPATEEPALFDAEAEPRGPRPAGEHLVLAGLRHRRAPRAGVRALALAEVQAVLRADPVIGEAAALVPDPGVLARHQLAALRELDQGAPPPGAPPAPPGPWFGWVGRAAAAPADPGPELYVTRLEELARCPWQAFLRRELGLEPVPDALEALPAPTTLLLGGVVHAVLERIVAEALPAPRASLADALARGPVRAPWPDAARLEAWLEEAATRVARGEGIEIPGFAKALARRARSLLDAARATDWADPAGPPVLGAELRGELEVEAGGRIRRIGFVADRADLAGDRLRVTDYKATKPLSTAAGADARWRALVRAVGEGRLLQGAAYRLAAAALAPGGAAEGRYLYLGGDAPQPARVVSVADDAPGDAVAGVFATTVRRVLAAVDHGALAPRLDGSPDEPPCSWCEVSAACLQGESSARRRFAAWKAAASEETASPPERALLGLARLLADAKAASAAGSGSGSGA
ncbi:MAG: PD-(D/E)XK nuclease family protein [Deltaproteobacteria bacterium]|nr:PD-(D/E)XK nuclease family protein [Deltaproteobacteria bacterium]